MAKFWRQDLAGLGHHIKPVIEPLNPLQLMRRGPVEAIMRAQDQVVTMSRRIVASGGMRGSLEFLTPDTNPASMAGTHQGPDERRSIGAGSVDLTPGCFLRLWATLVPSGETQITGTTPGGPVGQIEVEVVWTDEAGLTVTTSDVVGLPASPAVFGAQPAVMWDEIHRRSIIDITPPGLADTSELRRWCRGANVQVEIFAIGGARVVDAVVFEQPSDVAFEADDSGDGWTSHLYGPETPGGPAQPLQYPWQRFSETTPDGDPRGGTLHLLDVHHAQHQRLGPVLFSWSAAQESTGDESVTVTGTSFVELAGGGATTTDLDEPGLCCGTGGYARRQSSNSVFVLDDRVAVIPVVVRAIASANIADGVVRVMTRSDSFIDLTVPSGASALASTYGWLEVGINPDDSARTVPQLFGVAGGGGAINLVVKSVTVHYAGGYVPAV